MLHRGRVVRVVFTHLTLVFLITHKVVGEALSGRIKEGQSAVIYSDSVPGTAIPGTVLGVSVLAESGGWRDPNRRDYTVRVLLDADPELGKPLESASEYLKAEVVYAASHEGAQHLEDILTRRTRISIEVPDRGEAAAEEVARLVAPILGWDDQHVAEEIEHYRLRVLAERDSQQQLDDDTADAARLGAPDVRLGVG